MSVVSQTYEGTIESEIYSAAQIAAAIERLAGSIAADFAGQPLLLLGVLKGALYVVTDLARAIAQVPGGPSEIIVDFICVSSYGNATRSSGEVRLLKDTSETVTSRNVVIVEDIVDNGLTLEYLHALLAERNPAQLRTCVLFDKPYHRRVNAPLDYVGLQCPDAFVVGYGLDYQELFRNLPYLARLQPWVFSPGARTAESERGCAAEFSAQGSESGPERQALRDVQRDLKEGSLKGS